MMKTLIRMTAFAVALSATAAHAQSYGQQPFGYGQGGGMPQAQAQRPAMKNDPAIKVKAQLAGLRAFLAEVQNGPIDPKMALDFVEKQIAPDVDFATMTRMALGPMARRMSNAQKANAQATLRTNFATKIVEAMGDIRGTRVQVGSTRPGQSQGELVVPVRVERWQGRPLSINFRFYKSEDDWKVFDATANGQSAVLFYRGWFARQLRSAQMNNRQTPRGPVQGQQQMYGPHGHMHDPDDHMMYGQGMRPGMMGQGMGPGMMGGQGTGPGMSQGMGQNMPHGMGPGMMGPGMMGQDMPMHGQDGYGPGHMYGPQ